MAKLPGYMSVERGAGASMRIKVKTWHPGFWLSVVRGLLRKP